MFHLGTCTFQQGLLAGPVSCALIPFVKNQANFFHMNLSQ